MDSNSGFDKSNHTQVPNDLFDEYMKDLTGAEIKVVMTIIRKTRGWHKETDLISYSQIEEISGLGRESISRAISGLKDKKLITIDDTKKTHSYEINYSDGFTGQSVRKSNRSENQSVRKSNRISSKIEPEIGSKIEHTKETVKETTQNKDVSLSSRSNGTPLNGNGTRAKISKILKGIAKPEPLKDLFELTGFSDAYLDWCCHVKESKSKWPTTTQVQLEWKTLYDLLEKGHDPIMAIHKRIKTGWSDFYPVRDSDSKSSDSDLNVIDGGLW